MQEASGVSFGGLTINSDNQIKMIERTEKKEGKHSKNISFNESDISYIDDNRHGVQTMFDPKER
jgi:hypothetical protein